jgi:diguanylate cyclase (GGDEF)-like protein/PAS domain S-box-containing protein
MRTSSRVFERAFARAAVPAGLVSAAGRFLEVNEALCEFLGHRRDDLLAMRFQDVTHPDDVAPDEREHARVMSGRIDGYALDKRYLHADGRVRRGHLEVRLVRDATGSPDFVVAQILDPAAHVPGSDVATGLVERADALRDLADHDPLTGLRDRRRLLRDLHRQQSLLERHGTATCVVVIGLHRLDAIVDAAGREAADSALRAVADALRRRTRETDSLARLGEDAFAVVARNTHVRDANVLAADLVAEVSLLAVDAEGAPWFLHAVAGAAPLRLDRSFEATLAAATDAMRARGRAG